MYTRTDLNTKMTSEAEIDQNVQTVEVTETEKETESVEPSESIEPPVPEPVQVVETPPPVKQGRSVKQVETLAAARKTLAVKRKKKEEESTILALEHQRELNELLAKNAIMRKEMADYDRVRMESDRSNDSIANVDSNAKTDSKAKTNSKTETDDDDIGPIEKPRKSAPMPIPTARRQFDSGPGRGSAMSTKLLMRGLGF